MIITNDFVMLNFPKTASTFARKVMKVLYGQRLTALQKILIKLHIIPSPLIDLQLPKIDRKTYEGIVDQHGTFRQIPLQYLDRPVVSISRNPLERYISTYLHGWWVEHPPLAESELLTVYPHFPKLSFSEYYEMLHTYGIKERLGDIEPKVELGYHSIQFIQFYCNDPLSVLKKIDNEYIENGDYKEDLAPVFFIHQENLITELKAMLLRFGFSPDEISFVDTMKKINVTETDRVKPVLERETVEKIVSRDKLIFKIFPEYLPKNLDDLGE